MVVCLESHSCVVYMAIIYHCILHAFKINSAECCNDYVTVSHMCTSSDKLLMATVGTDGSILFSHFLLFGTDMWTITAAYTSQP
jgi:hypothetical protein